MITEYLISIFKFIVIVLIRIIICTLIWNFVFVPAFGLQIISGVTMFHIWLFAMALISSFQIEEINVDDEDDEQE